MSLTEVLAPLSCASVEYPSADYPVIRLDHPAMTCAIALHGAHVMQWAPKGEKPVLYTSPTAIYKEGKAIRGGVPICWPWFNAHSSDPEMPNHGIARNRFWQLEKAQEEAEEVTLTFSLPASPEAVEILGHEFKCILRLNIGAELRIHLMTENTSDQTFRVGGALHSYFAVSDSSQVSLSGLDGIKYIDTVGKDSIEDQSGDVTIDGEVDSIYVETSDTVIIQDPAWRRNVHVTKTGSSTTVVWNPGPENAAALGDLPDAAYKDFVCVEAANARRDVYDLEPGQLHCLVQTISLSPIE